MGIQLFKFTRLNLTKKKVFSFVLGFLFFSFVLGFGFTHTQTRTGAYSSPKTSSPSSGSATESSMWGMGVLLKRPAHSPWAPLGRRW